MLEKKKVDPMSSIHKKKAIIIGGGIGGLAAGIALRHAGLEVTVYERTQQLLHIGTALVLWPNAIKALHKLGLTDQIAEFG
jgi:FAD-dependent urate hydroxylase